jgi:hypothetical protein
MNSIVFIKRFSADLQHIGRRVSGNLINQEFMPGLKSNRPQQITCQDGEIAVLTTYLIV